MTYVTDEIDAYVKVIWHSLSTLKRQVLLENTYRKVVQDALNKSGTKKNDEVIDELTLNTLLVLLELLPKETFTTNVNQLNLLEDEEKQVIISEITAQLFDSTD